MVRKLKKIHIENRNICCKIKGGINNDKTYCNVEI